MEIAKDMLSEVYSDETFLNSIITGDETFVYDYDRQNRLQASE